MKYQINSSPRCPRNIEVNVVRLITIEERNKNKVVIEEKEAENMYK
jgi:hypothetical protein